MFIQSILSHPYKLADYLRGIISDEDTRLCLVVDSDDQCAMHWIDRNDKRSSCYLAETLAGKQVWVKGCRSVSSEDDGLRCIVYLNSSQLVVDNFVPSFSRKIYNKTMEGVWSEACGPFSVRRVLADLRAESNSNCSPKALEELWGLGVSGDWFERVELHEDRIILVPPESPHLIDGHSGEPAKMRILHGEDGVFLGWIFDPALEPRLASSHRIILPQPLVGQRVESQIKSLPHIPLAEPSIVAFCIKNAAIASRGEGGWRKAQLEVFSQGKCNLRVTTEIRKFRKYGLRCISDLSRPQSWGPAYVFDDGESEALLTLTAGILTVDVYGAVMKRYIYLAYKGWALDRVCGSVQEVLDIFDSGEVEDAEIIRAQLLQINPLFTTCHVSLHKDYFRVVVSDGTEYLVEHFRGMPTSWEVKSPLPPQSSIYTLCVSPERVFVIS